MITLGVCYYPEHWEPARRKVDAARMSELGIEYVRIAEFAWSKLEPARGVFDFNWLDEVIDILGTHDLKVVMCTPTATPPAWLIAENPDMLAVDKQGRVRKFGSRRHYSFSSDAYNAESARITEIIVARYGQNKYVSGWQTDNEYGCHDTVLCYSENARRGFVKWLKKKYGSIQKLNTAWGNIFWSMEYSDFEQIECPNLNVTEPNPSQVMDFRRFSSDQVIRFNRTQTEIIRRLSPGRFITHNSMGMFFDYDHYPFAEDLDFMSWDNYPLGFLSVSDCFDADEKQIYLRTGHPDLSPFMHDLFRGQSAQKKFWVIEQQPGPVNWAPYNPAPAKGIVRLWTWQNFAHGAETVSYFRWRRCHFAQEQMHAGLNAPDGEFTEYADEVRRTENEIKEVNRFLQHTEYKQAALVFDYENFWHLEIQPQGSDFKPLRLFMNFYRALRELGLSVDIVPKTADLSAYPLVVIPCMPFEDEVFCKKIQSLKSRVMIGPRTFSKTTDFQLPESSGLNLFSRLFNFRIRYVESLPASYRENVYPQKGGNSYVFSYWKESLTTGDRPVAWYADGEPAAVENGNFTYCAFFPEADFLTEYIAGLPELSVQLGQPLKQLPAGVRVRRLHNLYFYFNLSEAAYHIEAQQLKDKDVIVGAPVIAPNDLTVLCLK